uniref:Uncharacterized protein n=1 Tax=Dicentrarchus labrax TaxID=13489 RepID=E6ZFY0_DICLA|nr:Uncharacterized protein [Dicentrarchus labrax]
MVRSVEHQIPGARRGRKALRRSQVKLGKSSPSQPPNSFSLSLSFSVPLCFFLRASHGNTRCSLDLSTVILWYSHDYPGSNRKPHRCTTHTSTHTG